MVLLLSENVFNIINDKKESATDLLSILTTIAPIVIGLLALWFSHVQMQKTLQAKKQDEERAEIRKKLDELYGPLLQLRKKSNLLYEKFSESFRAADQNFSTLLYLLNSHIFTGNDKILLEEIINIGALTEQLIHAKAGLIDDTNLRTVILPRATTHFLILRLAYQGVLIGDVNKFKSLTFPKNLDSLLETRKRDLEKQLEKLNK